MQNQSEATLSHRSSPKPFRTTARIVGVLTPRWQRCAVINNASNSTTPPN
jgi:hypothetical protein